MNYSERLSLRWGLSDMTFSAERRISTVSFCYSRISLICLIYLSLLNLYFYTIRSKAMFLKVLTKVKHYYWLTYSHSQNLELLAINHSSSERRIIFVPRLLKLSHILVVLYFAWVRTSPHLSWIMRSNLATFPGCQGSCGKVSNGPTGSVVSFSVRQGLKC